MVTLFLDVDGVLNAEQRFVQQPKNKRVTGWTDWQHTKVTVCGEGLRGSFPFSTSLQMGSNIADTGADIVWATTWVDQLKALDDIARLVGLPTRLPTIDKVESSDRYTSGKLGGVSRYVYANNITQFVWVDDYLGSDDREWAADYDSLLIKPHSGWGLTRKDVEQIKTFVNYRKS